MATDCRTPAPGAKTTLSIRRTAALLAISLASISSTVIQAGAQGDLSAPPAPEVFSGPASSVAPRPAAQKTGVRETTFDKLSKLAAAMNLTATQKPLWDAMATTAQALTAPTNPERPPMSPETDGSPGIRFTAIATLLDAQAARLHAMANAVSALWTILDSTQKAALVAALAPPPPRAPAAPRQIPLPGQPPVITQPQGQ